MKYKKKEHESFVQRVENKVYFTNILVSENWKVFNIKNKNIYFFNSYTAFTLLRKIIL